MKVIFYKHILSEPDLTPTDRIIICQLLYMSLLEKGGVAFDSDGDMTLQSIYEDYNGYVPLSPRANCQSIMEIVDISRRQYYQSYSSLSRKGYIIKQSGEVCIKLVEMIPYFELQVDTGLHGNELIVYSYLDAKSRFAQRNGETWVDKNHRHIAKDLCMSEMGLAKTIQRLAEKGFLKRMRVGRYQVLLRTTTPQK